MPDRIWFRQNALPVIFIFEKPSVAVRHAVRSSTLHKKSVAALSQFIIHPEILKNLGSRLASLQKAVGQKSAFLHGHEPFGFGPPQANGIKCHSAKRLALCGPVTNKG